MADAVALQTTALAIMVTIGRLLTIPSIVYLVAGVGGPSDMLGGIVLDVVFGSWTFVRDMDNNTSHY